MRNYRITMLDDIEEAREIHKLAFPDDKWAGDHHTFWVARAAGGEVAGFCSAVLWEKTNSVFLSRAAVARFARGTLLHRQMIRTRVRWAKAQGAHQVVTYTLLKNYPSMINLLHCGFRFYTPSDLWEGKNVHYFRKTV